MDLFVGRDDGRNPRAVVGPGGGAHAPLPFVASVSAAVAVSCRRGCVQAAGITASKHNFTPKGPALVDEGGVCSACHIPHLSPPGTR